MLSWEVYTWILITCNRKSSHWHEFWTVVEADTCSFPTNIYTNQKAQPHHLTVPPGANLSLKVFVTQSALIIIVVPTFSIFVITWMLVITMGAFAGCSDVHFASAFREKHDWTLIWHHTAVLQPIAALCQSLTDFGRDSWCQKYSHTEHRTRQNRFNQQMKYTYILKPQQSFGSVVCFSIGITCFLPTFIHALIPRTTQSFALTADCSALNRMSTEPGALREKTDWMKKCLLAWRRDENESRVSRNNIELNFNWEKDQCHKSHCLLDWYL